MSKELLPGVRTMALSYMMDNGLIDNTLKLDLNRYAPDARRSGDPWEGFGDALDPSRGEYFKQAGGGVASSGEQQPAGAGASPNGKMSQENVLRGRVDHENVIKDPYPEGSSHVPHQDDWLNPDTRKLPPLPSPTNEHVISRDEARAVPVVAGVGLGIAGSVPGVLAAAAGTESVGDALTGIAGNAAGTLLGSLPSPADFAEKHLAGKILHVSDPSISHLENQKQGYTD